MTNQSAQLYIIMMIHKIRQTVTSLALIYYSGKEGDYNGISNYGNVLQYILLE